MIDTIDINRPENDARKANKRFARFLLLSGLIIVPILFDVFDPLFGEPEVKIPHSFIWSLYVGLFISGFCCCVASAFFTSYPLSRKFLLALLAVGLFVVDVAICILVQVFVFGLD